jgi:hypothetical protein
MTDAVVEWLYNNTTVQQAVGRNIADDTWKVYPVRIPQIEAAPYVCVRLVGIQPVECKNEGTTEDLERFQIDCFHNSYHQAKELYRIVRLALDGNSYTSSDGSELTARIDDVRDATTQEMAELAKREMWGIASFFEVDVSLGDIT